MAAGMARSPRGGPDGLGGLLPGGGPGPRGRGGFAIDRGPVTVAGFARFAEETGYRTLAERPPEAADYPDADPLLLVAGSAVFRPTPHPVPLYSAECVEGDSRKFGCRIVYIRREDVPRGLKTRRRAGPVPYVLLHRWIDMRVCG